MARHGIVSWARAYTDQPPVYPASLEQARAQGDPLCNPSVVTVGVSHTRAQGAFVISPGLGPESLEHAREQDEPSIVFVISPEDLAHTRAQGTPQVNPRCRPAALTHTRGTSAPKANSSPRPAAQSHTRALGAPSFAVGIENIDAGTIIGQAIISADEYRHVTEYARQPNPWANVPHVGNVIDQIQDYLESISRTPAPEPEGGWYPRRFSAGLYYTAGGEPGGDLTRVMVLNQVQYIPFAVGETRTFDRIATAVSAFGTAGAVLRLGIYGTTDGLPDELIIDAGTVDATTNGYKDADPISEILAANVGLYWTAIVSQVAICTVRAIAVGAGSQWIGAALANDARIANYIESGVTGALPANATPVAGTTQSCLVKLRAV